MRRLALPFVLFSGCLPLILGGCKQGYSPNTYASNAAQEEATVQRGVIIGVRQVMISATGTVGAATGGAAGGVAGAQLAGGPVGTALGAIGGTLVGGIGGAAAAQAVADTKGWEYIVQETGDKLVSVTQTSKTALPIGQNVLVISDAQQARIVPDYTVQTAAAPAAQPKTPANESTAAAEVHVSPLLPDADAATPLQVAPLDVTSDPVPPASASAPPADTAVTPASSTAPAATTVTPAPESPASADTAVAPSASSPAAGAAAAPQTVSNGSPAAVTPSTATAATPVQSTPAAPVSTPPVSSTPPATP